MVAGTPDCGDGPDHLCRTVARGRPAASGKAWPRAASLDGAGDRTLEDHDTAGHGTAVLRGDYARRPAVAGRRSQPAEATTQLVGRAPGGSTQPARHGTSVLGGHREPDRSRYRVMGVHAGTQEVVVAAHHRRDGPDWRAARVRPGIGVGTVHLHDLLRQPDEIDLASRSAHPPTSRRHTTESKDASGYGRWRPSQVANSSLPRTPRSRVARATSLGDRSTPHT